MLVLQDGIRTGSLASQSGDHGEPIDVLSLERLEVVKGPATLLYGSNAVGGVVNAISRHPQIHADPLECVRAYNDWISEFASYNPDRLYALGTFPVTGVEAAMEEIDDPLACLRRFAVFHMENVETHKDVAKVLQVELRLSNTFMNE